MDMERVVTELVAQVDSLEDKIAEQEQVIERLQNAVELLQVVDDHEFIYDEYYDWPSNHDD